uniref:Uncharacterized protein n=1 Tax=Avena sativa TaxID=4498 RepID=A0ACD5THF3_AVESA
MHVYGTCILAYELPPAATNSFHPVYLILHQQYFQQESGKLRHQIQSLQNANMHLVGESVGNLTLKELKNLENRLEKGIGRIRSKKHELLFAEIEYMQKLEADLQSENMYLRAKVADVERLALAPPPPPASGGAELEALPTFDARSYYHHQVNMLQEAAAASSSRYSQPHHQAPSRQDQEAAPATTALHLGYEMRGPNAN